MTRAIPIGWPGLIGKCRSIFFRYSHWSLIVQFGIMESTQGLWHSHTQSPRSFWPVAGIESSRSLPQAKRIVSSGDENGALVHSGQTTVHARDLSTSGDFRSLPSGHFLAMQCSIKFIDFNTLQNELCVGLWMRYGWASFYSWMNHYLTLNALPGMNKDFYGTKRKRGDPVWAKLPR